MLDVTAASPRAESLPGSLHVAFCETCEQLIFIRSLLENPRHQTRSQSAVVTRLLRDGLESVEKKLARTRRLVYRSGTDQVESTAASLGIAVAGLRQIHLHLSLLDTRWPHATVDLFVRKLAAEGLPVPVPTICAGERAGSEHGELGQELRRHLAAVGLTTTASTRARPILAVPVADLIDPLTWACLLYPLAAVTVERQSLHAQLHRPSHLDHDQYRRLCTAVVAARLVGESTYAALAVRALLARCSGESSPVDLVLLAEATRPFARPIQLGRGTVAACYAALLEEQRVGAPPWGGPATASSLSFSVDATLWEDLGSMMQTLLPQPDLPEPDEMADLVAALDDGRPINARPVVLPNDFAQRLASSVDAPRFYDLIGGLAERPCSLAAILGAGWRYKILRTYPLCEELMAGSTPWPEALAALTGHVLERCGLLQQSIEAAYVHQAVSRGMDQ